MALLELREVTARYGPNTALHGVSLAVDEGQIVSVLDASFDLGDRPPER